jgi:hypothetical protein
LTAPTAWIRGEDFEVKDNLKDVFKEREVKFGPDDADDFDLSQVPSSTQQLTFMYLLHMAVIFNRTANVRTLLAAGADAGHYWRGQTALFTAASIGRVWLVRMLHEHNASLDHPAVTERGEPVLAPLHAAAAGGHTNVVRYLLDNGADVKQPREAFQPHNTMTKRFSGSSGVWPGPIHTPPPLPASPHSPNHPALHALTHRCVCSVGGVHQRPCEHRSLPAVPRRPSGFS